MLPSLGSPSVAFHLGRNATGEGARQPINAIWYRLLLLPVGRSEMGPATWAVHPLARSVASAFGGVDPGLSPRVAAPRRWGPSEAPSAHPQPPSSGPRW